MANEMQPQLKADAEVISPPSDTPWLGCHWSSSTSASLTIHDGDLKRALATLRSVPAAKLSSIRTLQIMFSEPNLLSWHGTYWKDLNIVFEDEDIENYKRMFPESQAPSTPPPRDVFRTLLQFVANNFDLENLHLIINVESAAWLIFSDAGAGAYGGDEVEEGPDWRFIYEWYLDVGKVILDVLAGHELLDLSVLASIWSGMGPWITGIVAGKETVVPAGKVPRYHNGDSKLLALGESADGHVSIKRLGPGQKWIVD